MSGDSIPPSFGFGFVKSFHTCPNCGVTNTNKNQPENFNVTFVDFKVALKCQKCLHEWEIL